MKKEEVVVRQQVKALKRFYMDGLIFAIVNAILIVVWLFTGTSESFWPKYVLLVWGVALVFRAYRLGIFPLFSRYFYFLTAEWEEKKIKELTENHQDQRKIELHQSRKR